MQKPMVVFLNEAIIVFVITMPKPLIDTDLSIMEIERCTITGYTRCDLNVREEIIVTF